MKKFKYTRVRRKQNIIQKIKKYLIEDSDKNLFPYFLKKSLLIAVSFIMFIVLINFLILGAKRNSNNNLYAQNIDDSKNTSELYNKIVGEVKEMKIETNNIVTEEDIKDMPAVTSTPVASIEKASDAFYDYLVSDDSLVSDGTISLKYDEYIIEEGDNLSSISKKIGANLDTIVSVNKISNANKLRPGQTIMIPNRNGLLYVVKKDETLEEISDRYDVEINRVLSFNEIDRDNINTGDEIFLPGAKYTLDERIDKFGQMFSLPTVVTRISSVFGYRVHPITGVRRKHLGVDIPGGLNTPIYAARKGKVIFAGYSGGFGNLVIVRHDKGYTTYYGHLNKITTTVGANVGVGVMIGRMGSTGNSTGSHLHFEVRRNGVALNPADFIPIGKFIKRR